MGSRTDAKTWPIGVVCAGAIAALAGCVGSSARAAGDGVAEFVFRGAQWLWDRSETRIAGRPWTLTR